MKFGDTIEAHKQIHPEWSLYYLDYIHLVHILEDYQQEQNNYNINNSNNNNNNDDVSYASRTSNASTSTAFSSISIFHIPTHQHQHQQKHQHWMTTELLIQLHIQLEHITFFLLQQQGIIATQMSQIRNELRQHTHIQQHQQHPTPHQQYHTNSTAITSSLHQQQQQQLHRPPSNLVVHTTSNNTTGSSSSSNTNTVDMEQFVQQYEERYYQIGIQLLRLYQFIDINVTGIRKLLKKHDKIMMRLNHTNHTNNNNSSNSSSGGGHKTNRKHSKLLRLLLWNGNNNNNNTIHMNHTDRKSNTTTAIIGSSNNNNNNIHSVIPWSPRTGTITSTGSTGSNNVHTTGIYTRRKLSAEAFGNALLQPLLHDEGLTSITATLEVGIQELYALLIVPSSSQHHTRNPSDASLDFLWTDTTTTGNNNNNAPPPPISTPITTTTSAAAATAATTIHTSNINSMTSNTPVTNYGSTFHTPTEVGSNISSAGSETVDTITPLRSQSPPVIPIPQHGFMKNLRGLSQQQQQQQQQLPPKQQKPSSRPMGAQSAQVQSRKTFSHQHRPSFSSLRSLSTSTILGNNQNNNSATNTIPGLSSMDSLLIQIQMARRKLQQTNGYIQLLAAPMMMNDMDMMDDDDNNDTKLKMDTTTAAVGIDYDGTLENMAFIIDEEELQMEQSQINISNILNLGSSMLYMCNYYIVAPTSASYAKRLGGKASLASMIIGMTPVAALISTILFSWWTNHSYKHALIFASACSVLGNLLYSLGLPLDSITLVMVGRLLTGFGSARSINRRYICDTFPRSERTAASAAFVTASAMGMAAGPAIASILHYITTDENDVERVTTLYWQSENAPGWFMVFLWSIFLIALVVYFEDPPKKKYETAMKKAKSMVELIDSTTETKPLISDTTGTSTTDAEHTVSSSPVTTTIIKEPPIWRNIPVMITFLIYFVLKLILEAVLSSSAVLTEYYFDWDSGQVGWYLAALGLLVLPANAVVASLAQSYDDRELITGMQIALFIGCLCMLQVRETYHLSQYIIGTVLLVVSANALEGPNMSLLSQTIPKSWSTGIFNVGLLSTEAGTFGRAMGNVLLTLFGNGGLEHLVNRAFGTFSIISFLSLYITYYYYDYLEPWDVDD